MFTAHGVICGVFLFNDLRAVHLFASRIFMVSDVQGVIDFSGVLPYILKITCMGRELCNYAQYLLGNTHMQCVPWQGKWLFCHFQVV